MSKLIDLSIVLPCHNEEQALPIFIPRLLSLHNKLKEKNIVCELIVVDDGSRDSSLKILNQFPQILVHRHKQCLGYGEAIKSGMKISSGSSIAFLDADNTYCPDDLMILFDDIKQSDGDMAVGIRPFYQGGMPWIRALGNTFFCLVTKSMSKPDQQNDMTSGLRVINRRRRREVLELRTTGLQFSMELSLWAIAKKWSIHTIGIKYEKRLGQSKLNFVVDGFRVLWVILRFQFHLRRDRDIQCGS